MQPTEENGEKFYVAEGEWFVAEKESVTGAMLNGDARLPRSLAGARKATCMSFKIMILGGRKFGAH